MGKPDAPEGPDYEKLLQMTKLNIAANKELFTEYMAFARPAMDQQMERAGEQWDILRPELQGQVALSKTMRERYQTQGIPAENQYINKLQDWDSPERRAEATAQARQDVSASFDAERESMARQLEAYGVDPSQVRSGALHQQFRTQEALAEATAGTQAGRQIEREGLAMEGEAVNMYKGMPATSAGALGAGVGAGGAGLAGTGQAAQLGMQGFGQAAGMIAMNNDMANQSYGTANNIYGNQLAGWEVEMANSPLNSIAGLAGTWMGAGMPGFEKGGYVDPSLSPSGGAIPDDVPARLDAGEVVIPDAVVRYHGLKNITKLIDDAKRAGAIPEDAQ
jgi:hypothetical protein